MAIIKVKDKFLKDRLAEVQAAFKYIDDEYQRSEKNEGEVKWRIRLGANNRFIRYLNAIQLEINKESATISRRHLKA